MDFCGSGGHTIEWHFLIEKMKVLYLPAGIDCNEDEPAFANVLYLGKSL
jgi:hypothetical protein